MLKIHQILLFDHSVTQMSDSNVDNQLNIQIKETYGKIKIISQIDNKPIRKAYIKVFAKIKSGYTDIHDKFDYVSVSSHQMTDIQKFALLIITRDHGYAIKYPKPPKS